MIGQTTKQDTARPSSVLSRRALLCSALAGAALTAAGAKGARAASDAAKRIVVAGGALTEIIYAIGLSDRIAGVDTTSTFPPEALKDKAHIGYVRQLSPEGVLSLQPDILLAQDGAGPPEALALVEQAGVRIARATEAATEQGVLDRIALVGEVMQASDRTGPLAQQVKNKFAALAEKRGRITRPMRVMFILSLQNGRPMVAGAGTSADGMLRLAGAENVATGFHGYKPMTDEAVIEAAPEAILMMSGGPRQHAASDVFSTPALAATPAAKARRLITMDGLYLLGFGPRAPDAALDVLNALYPELKDAR